MTAKTFELPLSLTDARWVVEQACRAPSIHNTQPWRFHWDGKNFEMYADTSRGLTVSDPDSRELVISCGAALYNLRLALRKVGYKGEVTLLPSAGEPRCLARVAVSESTPATVAERRAYAAMGRRHTHRGEFEDRPLAPAVAVLIQRAAEEENADLVFVNDPGQRRRVLHLARAAERQLGSDDRVQAELRFWTPPPGSTRRDGIPPRAYPEQPYAALDDIPPRDFDQGRGFGRLDPGESPPGVIAVLTTNHDLQVDWLLAGQALERALIVAAEQSAYAALHSQLVEVPDLRAELRRELCVGGYPQILLRFGYAPEAQPTPRRPVNDVLDLT
jgi:hypothetical protein